MRRFAAPLMAFLVGAVLALQAPSMAQEPKDDGSTKRTITVTGTSAITVDPDEAVVSLGVRTQAQRAQEAMDQNSVKMGKVIGALREMGLGDDDLATSMLQLQPRYDDRGDVIVGYDASNQIEVTITDLDTVGRVIDTAIDHGANVAGGITFRVSDANEGLDAALADAVRDAKDKAETMASAADAGIGRAMTISEQGFGMPGPYYAEAVGYAEAADVAVPIETPTIDTQVSVSVVWELV